jgi:alpha-beta hydrolase superfamily lysophospholipase
MSSSLIYKPITYSENELGEEMSRQGIRGSVQFSRFADGPIEYRVPYVVCGGISDKTVVYCHGSSGSLMESLPIIADLGRRTNLRVIGFDYPGYGFANGEPCERSLSLSLNSLVKELARPVLIGDSLGAGVVLSMMHSCSPSDVLGIHLISPFTKLSDVCTDKLPDDVYDNTRNIRRVRCPVRIYALKDDTTVPSEHSRRLYKSVKERDLPVHLHVHTSSIFDHRTFGPFCLSVVNP